MTDRVKISVMGITHSQIQKGAYAVLLTEDGGPHRIPVVVGISYELIKLAGRSDGIFTRIISAPGMWLQHITTCEPDDSQIECAIAALEAVIPEDENADRW